MLWSSTLAQLVISVTNTPMVYGTPLVAQMPSCTRMNFKHPTTSALGEHLNGKPIIFKRAKLTPIHENNEHILGHTMQKYMAVIDVSEVAETGLQTTAFIVLDCCYFLSLFTINIKHISFAHGVQDRTQLSIINCDSDCTDEDDVSYQ